VSYDKPPPRRPPEDDLEERIGIGIIIVAAFVAALCLWAIWGW
jgi:hypothetical protein